MYPFNIKINALLSGFKDAAFRQVQMLEYIIGKNLSEHSEWLSL